MKKIIYLLAVLTSLGFQHHTSAQCTISGLSIKLNGINTRTCEATFDLSWTQELNGSNNFVFVHIWSQDNYHTPASNWTNMYSTPNQYPQAADLLNTLATFVIDDNHGDNPLIGTVYYPDPTFIIPQSSSLYPIKVHLTNTLERMTVQNIKITLPSCTIAQSLYFDIWASQSGDSKTVSCTKQGASLVINQLKIVGLVNCTEPPGVQVTIQNSGPALSSVTYKVYLDYAPYAVLNATDTMVFASDVISLPANTTTSFPSNGFQPYTGTYSSTQPLITAVTVPAWSVSQIATMESGCGPLPVKFASFIAMKSTDNILLNWQTASEQHNRGFEVQRKLPGTDYETIAFVPSAAFAGNSEKLLSYHYGDMIHSAGIEPIFYRIKQTDLDGNYHFSEIRSVKNSTVNIALSIYPNPAKGTVNVDIPAGVSPVDMVLNDMAGKEIKSWNNLGVNHLVISNLTTGIYLLNTVVKQTGEKLINKIVVR